MKAIITIITIFLTHLLHAQQVAGTLVKDWEKTFSYDDHAIIAGYCANEDVVVLNQPADFSLHMVRYRKDGSVVWDSSYTVFNKIGSLRIASLKEDPDGNFFMLMNAHERDPMLVKFDATGRMLFVKALLAGMNTKKISDGISLFLKDSTLVCFGIKGGELWEVNCKKNGATVTESMYDWEGNHFISDIILNSKGEPVILAKAGPSDKLGNGESVTHVMKINYQMHRIEKWNSLPGKNAKISQLPNGGYALLIDTATSFPRQDFWLHLLDQQLVLRSSSKIFDQKSGITESWVMPWMPGLMAIAAIRNGQLTLFAADYQGRLTAEYSFPGDNALALRKVTVNNLRLGCFYEFKAQDQDMKTLKWLQKKQAMFSMDHLIGKE